jgi:hypothetical protein
MPAVINGTNGLLQAYDRQVLTTGFSYTFAAGTQVLMMNPAGTLATGTVTMPASPSDGMTISFSSTQIITALTVNANTGQTINNAVTSLSAGQSVSYIYRLASTAWFPYTSDSTGSIGYGQTWQVLTGSRAMNTTYTNSTGKPIYVYASQCYSTTGTVNYTLIVGGITVGTAVAWHTNSYAEIDGIVPAGATYQITASANATGYAWSELR